MKFNGNGQIDFPGSRVFSGSFKLIFEKNSKSTLEFITFNVNAMSLDDILNHRDELALGRLLEYLPIYMKHYRKWDQALFEIAEELKQKRKMIEETFRKLKIQMLETKKRLRQANQKKKI